MTKTKSACLAFLAIALSPMTAHATLISFDLGEVVIGGTLYDVVLHQDDSGLTTFNNVYGTGDSPFLTFITEESATLAAQAIFDYAVAQAIDLSPFSAANAALVPFSATAGGFSYLVAYVSLGRVTGPFSGGPRVANSIGSFATFAVAQVPEPGTLALLGIGLFGMGLAKRRMQ